MTVLEKVLDEIEDYGKYKGVLKLEENSCDNWVPVSEIKRIIRSHMNDVENVIKKLEKIKTDNSCSSCTYREKCDELQEYYNPDDNVDLCGLTIKELAIEIVKSNEILK